MKKNVAQPNLVLMRHGESLWNRKQIFTGWVDIALSRKGERQARSAGRLLKANDITFDEAHTSVLKRAVKTLWLALEEMDALWLPTTKSWRLNERHYGALQGQSKAQIAKKFGQEQYLKWRRGFDYRPEYAVGKSPYPECSPQACGLKPAQFPHAESLKDTSERVLPYWKKNIAPALSAGRRVLVVAHGNSLRAIIKHLENISDQDIAKIEISMAQPLAYRISKTGKVMEKHYLS